MHKRTTLIPLLTGLRVLAISPSLAIARAPIDQAAVQPG